MISSVPPASATLAIELLRRFGGLGHGSFRLVLLVVVLVLIIVAALVQRRR